MPSIANLTIADGAATPVNHTFSVVNVDASKAYWAEKTAGIAIGYIRMTHEVRQPKTDSAAQRVILGYEQPTTAVVDGVTKRVRLSSAQVTFNFAQDATDQEKKDLVAYVTNSLSNATVKPTLYNVEPFFG